MTEEKAVYKTKKPTIKKTTAKKPTVKKTKIFLDENVESVLKAFDTTPVIIEKNGAISKDGEVKLCPHISTVISHGQYGNIISAAACSANCALIQIEEGNVADKVTITLCNGNKIITNNFIDLRKAGDIKQ